LHCNTCTLVAVKHQQAVLKPELRVVIYLT
jgi:hypothetical protein